MFWNLVATVFAGLGAAGFALAIRSLTKHKAPKWLIPVFAGLGMMGYQVYIEYSWFDHMESMLPEGTVVVSTEVEQVFWRPWSYIAPQITGFTVLDTNSIQRDLPGQDVVRFYLYRFKHSYGGRVADSIYLLNCDSRELVPLSDEGEPMTSSLHQLPMTNSLLTSACQPTR
ncbi:hypothetical protein [Marinobacter caseinilyticus]|uniref:hypothetical protein n=1 Tax=Marinobacter caseinilyticus TaxID=2692195 RepID=UPI00140A1E60|nr:hypothetical protein [Marinobacter caseinilyticus]